MTRGALIVLEGCDRCGKSTQCKRLVNFLNSRTIPAELWRFPERTTAIGKVIDAYLRKEAEMDDQAAHLLFSANRWELMPTMRKKLEKGITLVVDRYAFSGVAFTSAKGLDMDWCKSPDAGLPVPDLLVHFHTTKPLAGFGEERYEVSEFQAAVKEKFEEVYKSLSDNVNLQRMDVTDRTVDDVGQELESKVLAVLGESARPSAEHVLW